MDYWGVVREAWSITRRTRPLWWLGLISAAQLIVYTFVVLMLVTPMAVIPQLIAGAQSVGTGASADSAAGGAALQTLRERALVGVSAWLGAYWPALVGGVVFVMAVWVLLGVFDVAAQPGLITQATAVAEHRPTSVGAGMRDGFRLWWRTVGLLAIAVLPGLIYLLAMALVLLFTVSLPLQRGQLPDAAAAMTGQLLLSPLSTLLSLVAIPLGVIVQLGLRSAVIDDAEWRPALRSGWSMLRTRFADVALMYLAFIAVTLLVLLVATIGFLGVGAFVGVLVAFTLTAGGNSPALLWVGGIVLGALSLAIFLALNAGLFTFQSVGWTLFWRRLTGRDPLSARPPFIPAE